MMYSLKYGEVCPIIMCYPKEDSLVDFTKCSYTFEGTNIFGDFHSNAIITKN